MRKQELGRSVSSTQHLTINEEDGNSWRIGGRVDELEPDSNW